MEKPARKPIRSTSWPTYDKGNVFVHDSDVRAAGKSLAQAVPTGDGSPGTPRYDPKGRRTRRDRNARGASAR